MNSSTDHIMVSIQIYVSFKNVVKKGKANSDQWDIFYNSKLTEQQ